MTRGPLARGPPEICLLCLPYCYAPEQAVEASRWRRHPSRRYGRRSSSSLVYPVTFSDGSLLLWGPVHESDGGPLNAPQRLASSTARLQLAYGFDVAAYS